MVWFITIQLQALLLDELWISTCLAKTVESCIKSGERGFSNGDQVVVRHTRSIARMFLKVTFNSLSGLYMAFQWDQGGLLQPQTKAGGSWDLGPSFWEISYFWNPSNQFFWHAPPQFLRALIVADRSNGNLGFIQTAATSYVCMYTRYHWSWFGPTSCQPPNEKDCLHFYCS